MYITGKVNRCLGCMEVYEAYDNICPYCGYMNGTPPSEMFHLKPGTVLEDKYILGKVLGYGGFGITYIAWDRILKRKVAIKEYLPRECGTRQQEQEYISIYPGERRIQFEKGLRMFLDEAGILMRFLDLRGVVRIFDRFEENNTAYIVMEYLAGETLRERLDKTGPMTMEEAKTIISPVMDALITLHNEGVIHRDISPDNIFLTESGDVCLIDFGSAKHLSLTADSDRSVVVKRGYAPPEQYQMSGNQGPWTDVYALAVVIYRMITGVLLDDAPERLIKDHYVSPAKYCKDITKNQEKALKKALELSDTARTPSMEIFKEELFKEEPKPSRRGKGKLGILAAVLVLLVTIAVGKEYIPFDQDDDNKEHVNSSTSSTETKYVGNYKNRPFKEAKEEAKEQGVTLEVVDTCNEFEGVKQSDDSIGNILSQVPEEGDVMNPNKTVQVVISAGTKTRSMRNYCGISQDIAENQAREEEKLILVTEQSDKDSSVIPGYIVRQNKKAGDVIPEGSSVTLYISRGRDYSKITGDQWMPSLKGISFGKALKIAKDKGFYLGITKRVFDPEVKKGKICKQSVEEDELLERNQEVLVEISKGPEMMPVPDVRGQTLEQARKLLKEQKLVVAEEIVYEYNSSVPKDYVIEQSEEPGSKIAEGSEVSLTVSKGEKPKKKSKSKKHKKRKKHKKKKKSYYEYYW